MKAGNMKTKIDSNACFLAHIAVLQKHNNRNRSDTVSYTVNH